MCFFLPGKIPKLFEENSLDSSSCVALVNAIYFKGQWAKKFNPENTREEAFHLNKVDLLHLCICFLSSLGKRVMF